MLEFTTDQWVILGLVFALGALIGMWLTSGPRRKWKNRYHDEVKQRKEIEQRLEEREKHWNSREKDWRERETLLSAANRDRGVPGDRDGDGYRDQPVVGGPRHEPFVEDRMRDRHPEGRSRF